MNHNITASRLNDYAEFVKPSIEPDSQGTPVESYELIFDCRCDVMVKSGSQVKDIGIPITQSVISILTWFNDKVKSGQRVIWRGNQYEVIHIMPDSSRKGMIITAESHGDQSYD